MSAGVEAPFHLVRLCRPGDEPEEHFDTLADLARRILAQLDGPHVYVGDAHVAICALGAADRIERDACYVARCDENGVRGAPIGFAVLPFDPAFGSYGARTRLVAALKKLAPTVADWAQGRSAA